MADVFISYSQKVPEPTVALADALTQRGFRPWYDVNLLPGEFFGKVIDDAIDNANAVVTIWSPPALTSKWVPAESSRALNQNKLICVRTKDVDPKTLPTPFHTMHVPIWEDVNGIFQKLVSLGVRPSGGLGVTDLEVLAANAARDWRLIREEGQEELEAFLAEYGSLAMYRRMAELRLRVIDGGRSTKTVAAAAPQPILTEGLAPILRIEAGMHTAMIKRIGVSRDGRMLATASDDKTVRLWSLPGGTLLRVLRWAIGEGDQGKVYAVAMDPMGQWVAAGGWCSTSGTNEFVTLFDTAMGRVVHRLGPLPNVVHHLAVSGDGATLAAGLGGGAGLHVWRRAADGWQAAWEDRDYDADIYGVAFAPGDSGALATTSYDGHIRLYDPNGRLMKKAKAPGGERPRGFAFHPDGQRLAVGYGDTARVDWLDARTLDTLYQPDVTGVHTGHLSSVAVLTDGTLVAGGRYGREREYPLLAWRASRAAWPGPGNTIGSLAALPDGGVVYGAGDPAFGIVSAMGERVLHRGPATCDLRGARGDALTVSRDGVQVRFGLKLSGTIPHLFDLRAGTLTPSTKTPDGLIPASVAELDVRDWINSTTPTLAGKPLPLWTHESSRALAIAPDATRFAIGADWSLYCFASSGHQTWPPKPAPATCWGVNWSPDGRVIVAAYGDGTIRWHRASDGAEVLALFVLVENDAAKDWVCWTPKGHFMASENGEGLIGWHVNRGEDQAADFYPAHTFAETFRKPDIVKAALDGI
jgi:WD40 repeat protein